MNPLFVLSFFHGEIDTSKPAWELKGDGNKQWDQTTGWVLSLCSRCGNPGAAQGALREGRGFRLRGPLTPSRVSPLLWGQKRLQQLVEGEIKFSNP